MNGWTAVLIECCWIAWIVYWLAMASRAKRTLERAGFFGYRLVGLIITGAWVLAGSLLGVKGHSMLWQRTLPLGITSDCIVLAGIAFTVWARITLGGNWSAEVTFKEDHELIESGPYALARHPIYTGLILMGIGTAINYGRAIGLGVLVSICGALWWKAREEERIMTSHFPGAYSDYRRRVHAIIPFVL
jgi:protein-S-isoprenylcysteine O-methyltransferase Ste14